MEDVCLDTASRGLRGLGPPPGWWRRPAANVTRIILASIRPRAYHLSLKPVLWGHRRFAVIDKIHWASQLFEESGTVLAFAVLRNNGVCHFWALFPPRIFAQIWAMETSVLAIFSGPAKTPSIKHCSSRRSGKPSVLGVRAQVRPTRVDSRHLDQGKNHEATHGDHEEQGKQDDVVAAKVILSGEFASLSRA